MRLIMENDTFTVATIVKILADMQPSNISAILNIVEMMKKDEKLKNLSDDTIYSYYKAEIETVGVIQNAGEDV